MTTDEWVSEVYSEWGEDPTNSIVSIAQVTAWGNRAQRQLCIVGNVLLACAKGPFVAGQETYNLPGSYLKIDAGFLTKDSGAPDWLRPMDVADRDPSQPAGMPKRYWIHGEDVNNVNQYVIGFWPVPNVTTTGPPAVNYWDLFYRKRPDTMVHSTQGSMVNPEVLPEFQDAMTDYALGMIYRRLGQSFQGAFQIQMNEWEKHLAFAKQYINPITLDYPSPRRDTAGLLYEWP